MAKFKPIAFLDIETTGTDVNVDRIIELAIIRFDNEKFTSVRKFHGLFNPEIPINKGASETHGYYADDVKKFPLLKSKKNEIIKILDGADIGGYNSNKFDIPLLYNELARIGFVWDISDVHFVDVFNIFKNFEGRSLSDAVFRYLGRSHDNAHNAMEDIKATAEVYQAQILKYEKLQGMSRKEIHAFCMNGQPRVDLGGSFTLDKDGEPIFTFGKHKDKKLRTEWDYANWMLDTNFHSHTKDYIVKYFISIHPDKIFARPVYKKP